MFVWDEYVGGFTGLACLSPIFLLFFFFTSVLCASGGVAIYHYFVCYWL